MTTQTDSSLLAGSVAGVSTAARDQIALITGSAETPVRLRAIHWDRSKEAWAEQRHAIRSRPLSNGSIRDLLASRPSLGALVTSNSRGHRAVDLQGKAEELKIIVIVLVVAKRLQAKLQSVFPLAKHSLRHRDAQPLGNARAAFDVTIEVVDEPIVQVKIGAQMPVLQLLLIACATSGPLKALDLYRHKGRLTGNVLKVKYRP